MMRNFITLIVVLIIPGLAYALDISGYYELSVTGEAFDGLQDRAICTSPSSSYDDWGIFYWNQSKLRLDFRSGGADNELSFDGNLNFLSSPASASRELFRYLPGNIEDEWSGNSLIRADNLYRNRIWLDNAFLTWRRGSWRVRAGRQQLSWGPGYMYNPTDLFHLKNAVDPNYEKEGVSALRVDYNWGIGGQVTTIIVPDLLENRAQYACRLATYLPDAGLDIAFTGHLVRDRGKSILHPASTIPQTRIALGIEASGTLLGLGAWLEGNYNWMEIEDNFLRMLGGVDYTLESGMYLIGEVLYNGRGTASSPYATEDWVSYILAGEPLGELLTMVGIRKDLTSFIDASGYVFVNGDGTVMLNPRIDVNVAQNADLTIFGTGSFGDEDGQFHSGYYSAFGRVTVYF